MAQTRILNAAMQSEIKMYPSLNLTIDGECYKLLPFKYLVSEFVERKQTQCFNKGAISANGFRELVRTESFQLIQPSYLAVNAQLRSSHSFTRNYIRPPILSQ